MFGNMFDRKFNTMREYVEAELKYAERMKAVYLQEYKENPGNVAARQQYDTWAGRVDALMGVLVRMESIK